MSIAEEWRPVVGFEGWYEVSNQGRVKRVAAGTRGCGLLNPARDNYGYFNTHLSSGNGARVTRRHHRVHKLVAAAFLGPCPPGYTVNHIDGDKLNNTVGNLEYVSRSDNLRHAGKSGLMAHGEQNGRAVLTADMVREIRRLAKELPQSEICRRFNLDPGHVSMIVNRRIWKQVA